MTTQTERQSTTVQNIRAATRKNSGSLHRRGMGKTAGASRVAFDRSTNPPRQGVSDFPHHPYAETICGDHRALSAEFNARQMQKIFRTAHRITRNRQDAEDAVEDACLQTILHLQVRDQVKQSFLFFACVGSIILNGSIADIKGFPAMSVYSATKAAVRSFARTWTNDLRSRRIRVNVLSAGHIDTPIMECLEQGEALTRMKKEMENNVPLGRLGNPGEIVKAVSFLASDEASYVSGTELYVDGGVAQI